MNKKLLKESAELFLKALEVKDLNIDVLQNTPARFANGWAEMLSGYLVDDKDLYKTFSSDNNNLVIVKDIEFTSVCEHHLLPFSGTISIGYIPKNKVLGLSKFARIVDCFARRLQLQEKLVINIAESLMQYLEIDDLFIVAEAKHDCMRCRGVNQKKSSTITFFSHGKFKEYRENELLDLIKK